MCTPEPTLWPAPLRQFHAPEIRPGEALLDPQESPVEESSDADNLESLQPSPSESFRHSGWKTARKRVYDGLKSTHQSITRIQAFANCGTNGWILRSVDRPLEYRFATNACHDRLCVPCAGDRARTVTHQILATLKGEPARFVTLTLRGGEVDLAFGIDRLLRCFRRLRQRKFWKFRVKGGVYFVEFKWSRPSRAWHVHLHVICHGRYIPKEDLISEWYHVTGDSIIVDVSFVRAELKVARYVAKYVTKPWDRDDVDAFDRLEQIITGSHRRRLIGGFGDWQHVALTEHPEAGEWIVVGDLETVVSNARSGDADAIFAIESALGDNADKLRELVPEAREPPEPRRLPQLSQLRFPWPTRRSTW